MSSPSRSGLLGSTARLSRLAVGRVSGRVGQFIGNRTAITRTARFLRQQLWIWPVFAAVFLAIVGWWVSSSVESAMRDRRADELTAILNADIAGLRAWMEGQTENARLFAADELLLSPVMGLLQLANAPADRDRELIQSKALTELRKRLIGRITPFGYTGFFIVSPDGLIVAAEQDPPVGKRQSGYRKQFFVDALTGPASVSRPFRSQLLLADHNGDLRANLPTMFTAAAIRGADDKPIAVLGLRMRPEDHFTRILQVAQSGKTGDTYAIDQTGLFLSQSRFDEELKQNGLLADQPDVQSILTLEARDPQADILAGERPKLRRADRPLTRMAADLVAGTTGLDVYGYRDYRGTDVIGAWQWLPEYGFGVATEVSVAEAFRPLYILRRAFWSLLAMLGVAAAVIYGFMVYATKQQRALQEAVLAARQLGQYSLEEKIGAGGMGTVYKARHSMLRRPTAVKLLEPDKVSDVAIARFEREVQLTSQLNHPNTIAVFDYGKTPEGIFYYAMEYLDGIDLEKLVERYGPLPEGRVVSILAQICGSLAEAHAAGLIHRDIKPANILLNDRGGVPDMVKVLDFGLAKALGGDEANVTQSGKSAGTPLYMAPEALEHPDQIDGQADVYAVGAVGYFLLTGTTVFQGDTVVEVCMHQLRTPPEPPSQRLGRPITPNLESILLKCLEKRPADRPAGAAVLRRELLLSGVATWTDAQSEIWWRDHRQGMLSPESNTSVAAATGPAVNTTAAYVPAEKPAGQT